MSPEKQRIAIAEVCGLHTFGYTPSITGRDALVHVGEGMAPQVVPDYLNDLNAMHEVWLILNLTQRQRFVVELGKIGGSPSSGYWPTSEMLGATAAQRAQAFLRTIGKWEDDK